MITAIGTGIGDEFDIDEAPLPPDHRDDGCRRRRLAHPHADPHVPLPPDAGADRARPRLHRRAAALQGQARQPGVLLREGRAARGAARARADPGGRGHRPRRRRGEVHRGALDALREELHAVRGLARPPALRLRRPGRRAVVAHRLVEHDDRGRRPTSAKAIAAIAPNGYELESLERGRRRLARAASSRRETSTPRNITVPVELLASPIYAPRAQGVREAGRDRRPAAVHASRVGKETERAETYDELRDRVLDAAKAGHPDLAASRASAR